MATLGINVLEGDEEGEIVPISSKAEYEQMLGEKFSFGRRQDNCGDFLKGEEARKED